MRSCTSSTLFLCISFLLVWLAAKFLLPLTAPFLLGLFLALAAEPVVSCLTRQLRVPRSISAGIGVLTAFGILAMVLLLLCALLVRELGMLTKVLPDLEQTARTGISLIQSWLLDASRQAPPSLEPLLQKNITALFSDGASLLGRITGWLLGLAGGFLSHVPDSALGLGTAIISGCMISSKLPRIRRWLLRRIPRQRLKAIAAAWQRIKSTLLAFLAAQCKLMGVTFLLLTAGFLLLRIPSPFLWAAGVCLVDVFPVLGTGTVLLPWALVCFLQADAPRAIGLLGLYATVSLTRSILEPRFLGRHLGLDPLVTLMALYAGYKLWGIAGMFLAPILTVVVVQLLPRQPRPQ